MKFITQKYEIEDRPRLPFISEHEIHTILQQEKADKVKVRDIIAKSLNKNRLSLHETATLINATEPDLIEEIKDAARRLKEEVYGSRIVLFAPLYVGNHCVNNCRYCGFRASNTEADRKTLSNDELIQNVKTLEDNGHKRLILVFGEHPKYSADYIAEVVRTVYTVRSSNGEIRRVNINAAPLDLEGFKKVKEAGIGTYQIFQETYHQGAYTHYHPAGRKADYNYRLTALDRAQDAGLDDVGIGALFGLYDWRFEVMGLIRHTNHLEACYKVGPHTLSFPRLQKALNSEVDEQYIVNDTDFIRIISILRLAVPYAGMILTAREPAHVRSEVIRYGCSQIDAGTKIEIGAYTDRNCAIQDLSKEQFMINDNRSLNEIMEELIETKNLPSFCTACYRLGRTGEHFMEFSVPGFIKRFCQPNAILTMAEYLEDYAPDTTKEKGYGLIQELLQECKDNAMKEKIEKGIQMIQKGRRDMYF